MSDEQQHRHEWVAASEPDGINAWACTGCAEASATCGTCGRASGTTLLLCDRCERQAAKVLDDIRHALGMWERSPRSPMRSPANMRLVRGGEQSRAISSPADIEERLLHWVARWESAIEDQRAS